MEYHPFCNTLFFSSVSQSPTEKSPTITSADPQASANLLSKLVQVTFQFQVCIIF